MWGRKLFAAETDQEPINRKQMLDKGDTQMENG